MAITKEQLAKIEKFVKLQLRDGCPNCRYKTFTSPAVVKFPGAEYPSGVVGPPDLPMVLFRCMSCGHGVFFDGSIAGVDGPPPMDPGFSAN